MVYMVHALLLLVGEPGHQALEDCARRRRDNGVAPLSVMVCACIVSRYCIVSQLVSVKICNGGATGWSIVC